MAKEKKIYHIDEARKLKDKAQLGIIISGGMWMIGNIAFPGLYSLPLFAAYTTFVFMHGSADVKIYNSYEFKQLKEAYREILKKYVKLNNDFDFKKPLDVYALFDFAYNCGVFDCIDDGEYTPNKYDSYFMSEQALNNHGVCRHIAGMLNDIYTELGLTSSTVVLASQKYKETTKEVEMPPEVEEQMKRIQQAIQIEINGKVMNPDIFEVGKPTVFETRLEALPITDKAVKRGDHLITQVNYDGKTYLLDPSKRNIFVPETEVTYLKNNDSELARLCVKATRKYNKRHNHKLLEILDVPSMDEQIEEANKALNIIYDNKSMILDFKSSIKYELETAEEMYKLILK